MNDAYRSRDHRLLHDRRRALRARGFRGAFWFAAGDGRPARAGARIEMGCPLRDRCPGAAHPRPERPRPTRPGRWVDRHHGGPGPHRHRRAGGWRARQPAVRRDHGRADRGRRGCLFLTLRLFADEFASLSEAAALGVVVVLGAVRPCAGRDDLVSSAGRPTAPYRAGSRPAIWSRRILRRRSLGSVLGAATRSKRSLPPPACPHRRPPPPAPSGAFSGCRSLIVAACSSCRSVVLSSYLRGRSSRAR